MSKFQFIFVRHGQTDLNIARRATGWHDISLNDTGRAQACEAGQAILKLPSEYYPQVIVHSGLIRAKETAEIIRNILAENNITTRFEQNLDLRERNPGSWEGKLWGEVPPGETLTRDELRVRGILPHDAENDDVFTARLRRGIAYSLDPANFGEGRRLFAWHGGVERIVRRIYGLDGADHPPPNAKVHVLLRDAEGEFHTHSQ